MNKALLKKIKDRAPPRAFREITFDRKKIKASIEPLSYDGALRVKGPIYEALEDEMYRSGCHMVPELLYCLGKKEQTLYEAMSIRERITDPPYRAIFYELIDKLQSAELAVVRHKFKGYKHCFQLFYDTIIMLEPFKTTFEYVRSEVVERIITICQNIDGEERDAADIVARIYLKYSEYLEMEGDKLGSMKYLQKALNLVRGHVWTIDCTYPCGQLLHEVVALQLAKVMLDYGHQVARNQAEKAVELATNATIMVAEVGREKNLALFCKTYLARAYFQMESSDFSAAHRTLKQIQADILKRTDYSFVKLNIQYYTYMGQIKNSFEKFGEAIQNLRKALRLCQLYAHRTLEAETLFSLGKIYAKDNQMTSIAKRCYEQAKKIYADTNDLHSKKKAVYLMAKLKADEITPLYMEMLKCSHERYCAFYNLRQWKNCCRPFWTKLGTELVRQEQDPIYCLLDEELEDDVQPAPAPAPAPAPGSS